MKRMIALALVAAMAVSFAPTTASAFFNPFSFFEFKHFKHFKHYKHFKHFKHFKHVKTPPAQPSQPSQPQKDSPNTKDGLNAWQWYITAATFCSAGSLIIGAAIKGHQEHRELTTREAWGLVGNCWIPFIGGPLFERVSHGNAQ